MNSGSTRVRNQLAFLFLLASYSQKLDFSAILSPYKFIPLTHNYVYSVMKGFPLCTGATIALLEVMCTGISHES